MVVCFSALLVICFRAEHEEKAVVVKPPSRIRKAYTVYDVNDIAYKVIHIDSVDWIYIESTTTNIIINIPLTMIIRSS